jgi:DNA ligase-1
MITKPTLATDFNESKLAFPYLAMPKIDGVRGINITGTITGRSLKPFPNTIIQSIFSDSYGFDGELTYGSITSQSLCRSTTSVVNTHSDTRAHSLVYNLFDYITPDTCTLPYSKRYSTLSSLSLPPNCTVIPTTFISSLDELSSYESLIISQGYEGVILRSPTSLPKSGRTTLRENSYLRIKRFIQEDAVVLSIAEALENTNPQTINELGNSTRSTHQANLVPKSMLGSIICQDIKSGNIITVSSGEMSHELRSHYWHNQSQLIGKVISYKHFPHGVKDKPRFPTFVTIRDASDLVQG